MNFSRLVVPVVSLFKNGELLLSAILVHFEWLYGQGIRAVLIGGTNGRFWSHLTTAKLFILLKLALDVFDEIYVNVSKMNIDEVKELIQTIRSLHHNKRVYLIYAPNVVSDWTAGDKKKCHQILKMMRALPTWRTGFFLYDIDLPETRGVTDKLIRNLSSFLHFEGLKDSLNTERDMIQRRVDLVERDCGKKLFSGPDKALALVDEIGAAGRISGGANIVPGLVVKLIDAARDTKGIQEKQEIQLEMDDIMEKLQAMCGGDLILGFEALTLLRVGEDLPAGVDEDAIRELAATISTRSRNGWR